MAGIGFMIVTGFTGCTITVLCFAKVGKQGTKKEEQLSI